jgi:monoamine oxidase
VSGISCGNELKSNFNVLILEARNRTLGRVYTEKKLFKTPMGKFKKLKNQDLGAHWIHVRNQHLKSIKGKRKESSPRFSFEIQYFNNYNKL